MSIRSNISGGLSSLADLSKSLISSDDREANIKHFIIFITAIHYFLASFMILFGIVRHTVDKDMMHQIMENDFYIICVGLGILTIENAASAFASRGNLLSNILRTKKTTEDGRVIVEETQQKTTEVATPNTKTTEIKTDVVNTKNIEVTNTNTVNNENSGSGDEDEGKEVPKELPI